MFFFRWTIPLNNLKANRSFFLWESWCCYAYRNTSSLTTALYNEVNITSKKEWMWNVTLAAVISGMYRVETDTGERVVPWAATAAAPAEAAGVGFLCGGGVLGAAGGRLAPRHRRLAVCRDRSCVLIHIRVNTQPLVHTHTYTHRKSSTSGDFSLEINMHMVVRS